MRPGRVRCNFGLVYESVDGGAHWSTIGNIGTNWNIMDVVAGSSDLRTLYAAVLHHGVLSRPMVVTRGWR